MSFIFGEAPKAPDPTATANSQQQYNQKAATAQNATNSYNQSTPFGTQTYVADPSSPSGYRLVTGTNAAGDTLINDARSVATNSAGMYSQPFDAGTATAQKLNQWTGNYLQPIFNQQDSNLEAQLRNQGLAPGTEAYNNAKNLLARNQGDVTTDYLTKNQAQAYGQAVQDYARPYQTVEGLQQAANPGQFANTPTAQLQPANYAGLVQSNYENQMKNYENNVNGVGKLITSGIGLAAAPFTGGTSLAAMGLSGAGNFIGNAVAPSGGYTGWTSGGWG